MVVKHSEYKRKCHEQDTEETPTERPTVEVPAKSPRMEPGIHSVGSVIHRRVHHAQW